MVWESRLTMPSSQTRSRFVKLSPSFGMEFTTLSNRAMMCRGRFRSLTLFPLSSTTSKSRCSVSRMQLLRLARTCSCIARGNACIELRMMRIRFGPAMPRKSAMLRIRSRETSRMSFHIFRPSWKRWYAEFVLKTRRRLRPEPSNVCAASVPKQGRPRAQWPMLTKNANTVIVISGWRMRQSTRDLGMPRIASNQSADVSLFVGRR
mmetsp:Transcript_91033/g.257176  ORF Transcript_91033/g.257176 Transcript_91033/m.257176 type:complete len:206 (-) Transcript_91033:304-921(-)